MSDATDGSTRSIEDRPLPPEVGANVGALFGADDRPETFGEWVRAVAAAFGDEWPPTVADLCHDDDGRHRAAASAQTYRFTCVIDAIMLPFLLDEPVEITSVDPQDGETVTAAVTRKTIETTPEGAVMSFGVAPVRADADPSPERVYRSLCPYVHAFPDRETYERWDEATDAATTGVPLADGFGIARAMIRA